MNDNHQYLAEKEKMGPYIEGRSNYGCVFTKGVHLGDGDVGRGTQSVQDAVLAFDGVGSLGQESSWRLLAEDILLFAILGIP